MNLNNGLSLAYIGDAYYELRIRMHLLTSGLTKVNDLHKEAIKFTSAKGQTLAMEALHDFDLTEDEEKIFKRGRNAESTHKPKNTDLATYHKATGFEALLGYLYLDGQSDRLEEIINKCIKTIEENSD